MLLLLQCFLSVHFHPTALFLSAKGIADYKAKSEQSSSSAVCVLTVPGFGGLINGLNLHGGANSQITELFYA